MSEKFEKPIIEDPNDESLVEMMRKVAESFNHTGGNIKKTHRFAGPNIG